MTVIQMLPFTLGWLFRYSQRIIAGEVNKLATLLKTRYVEMTGG